MKNRISFILFISVLFFASCTKETLSIPENSTESNIQERSTTIEFPVENVAYSIVSNEMIVDFSGNYDFSEVVLEDTQYLDFVDSGNNTSSLTFQINSFSGSNGTLQVVFSVSNNSLTSLTLIQAQEIIIEDDWIE